jgi:hypothetical protein
MIITGKIEVVVDEENPIPCGCDAVESFTPEEHAAAKNLPEFVVHTCCEKRKKEIEQQITEQPRTIENLRMLKDAGEMLKQLGCSLQINQTTAAAEKLADHVESIEIVKESPFTLDEEVSKKASPKAFVVNGTRSIN